MMDDTQLSRVSDAAATRKRRSSILKNQRPPRTPFSELEFNVATPTDTAKSRRVSFSRRTGVAEFVTNEATTTWKNFYEEHNKSLESSGNDSGSKAPVGHLGRRVFDQQFEEVEADFIGTLNTGPNINISSSLNNFEQQLATLECTDDIRLTAPFNNFELSALTNNHTKLFDDLAIPCGEVTDRIDLNFSTVQIGQSDDLDEIQKDLNLNFGQAPFQRQNISEYIEVDLNTTHMAKNEDDMSITDTIHSPKVQDVSTKKSGKNTDWEVDKENIAINPYAAPKESENFAINEEPDKVLVFDGKRLTIQSEKEKENYRQTLLPHPDKTPQRKTIVLNVNDDLPNFIDDPHMSNTSGFIGVADLKKSLLLDDMSITEPLQDLKKQSTVLYDDDFNISVTQGIPGNIVLEEKRRTILYEDNGDVSMTQAIPTNIIADKRRTIAFDKDNNISITQGVPASVIQGANAQTEKRRTIVFDDKDISMTQAVPVNILPDKATKRRTIVFEDNAGNLSITQAVPDTLVAEAQSEKRRTIVYENDTGNISVTQAIPSNIIIAENSTDRRRTVVFESDTGNISVTQAVPSNLILQEQLNISPDNINTQIQNENARRRTIVYENDTGHLSITQAVPNQVIQGITTQNYLYNTNVEDTNKRRTIVFDENADISVTQAVSHNQVICGIRNEQEENKLRNDTKETQLESDMKQIKPDVLINNDETRRRTVVFENDDADVSMTEVVPVNVIQSLKPCSVVNAHPSKADVPKKRRTVIFENDDANISLTQVVNINQVITGSVPNINDDLEAALNEALHSNSGKSQRTIMYDKENANIPISQHLQDKDKSITIPQNIQVTDAVKRRTIVFEDDNMAITQELTNNVNEIKSIPSDPNASGELDVSMTDVCLTESTTKHRDDKMIIQKSFNTDLISVSSISKPIPTNLSKITIEKEQKNVVKNTSKSSVVEPSKKCANVIVYQAALTKRTEQGDTTSQEIQDDEKLSSASSKMAAEINKNDEKISSSSKITDAVEVNVPTETADDEESHIQKESAEANQNTETDEKLNVDQNLSETHDDQSEASDATSQKSKSILNDLLDMTSVEDVDKGLMVKAKEADSEEPSLVLSKPCTETNSKDMFYITRDTDDEAQIQTDQFESDNIPRLTEHSPLPLEYKDQPEMVIDLEKKLEILKETFDGEKNTKNRHYERILSSDLDKSKLKDKASKSFKTANDTSELLEMLSDLTDKTITQKLDAHLEEDEEKPEPVLIKGHLALENKIEIDAEPKRFSIAPKRQSIVMSREDLLNNISMAGAALKSRLDFDDTDLEDTVKDTSEKKTHKKSVRMSNEVVKTLHFDDSISEISIQSEAKATPLKKTAFGEISYMQEHKAKVIPSFLKDVSDNIKELMDDLVKPNADVLPFSTGIDNSVRKIPSTCSTQIQANLVASSQIDINTGLHSNPDSVYDVNINKISSVEIINDAVNRSVSRALKSPIKSMTATRASEKSFDSKMDTSVIDIQTVVPTRPTEQPPGRVLIFDHTNPLNNILLSPERCTEPHRYNPAHSTETICSERSNSVQISLHEKDKDCEIERATTQYTVGNLIHSVKQSGDASSGKVVESESCASNLSKPLSIDQSTDTKLNDVKDIEVNTLIAMKRNKDLLDASSSLTLVDDALARSTFDVNIDSRTTMSQDEMSPVKVIYTVGRDEMRPDKLDSDFTSPDELEDRKSKKRNYSPGKREKHKNCDISSLSVTPKPVTKMQKLSESPDTFKHIDVSQSEKIVEKDAEKKKRPSRKSKSKKPGTSITVQQLITEYNVGPIDQDTLDEQIKDAFPDPKSDASSIEPTQSASQSDADCTSLDMVSSCTSSKNMREEGSAVTSSLSSKVSRMDWQPEVVDELHSKEVVSECDSSVNVVAKIDMLPFMGSHECEWESSSGDTWTFRLLHARLRLAVRLAHRHDNATRTYVRADTRVRAVHVETLPHDTKNTLAALCVSFAAETMRYFVSRGVACAGDVPALARRCAGAARLAARWGRAMSDARAHLAYAVTQEGDLTLKVANIPLRCVWEVSMRLELVVGDAREAPWVRAGGVRARRVLPAAAPGAEPRLPRALRHLPRDWSHAPRTIWKIFKYLKHKTRDDDELFMGL